MAGILGGSGGGQKTPRYTDINLQTSAQGLPIPLIWGQNRLGTNVIWYGDFKSRTTKQAGKGGGGGKGGSTYYYSCAVILAICEGPIQSIGRIWAGTKQTTLSKLDLTLFTGTATQAPWSYLTALHPTQALAYARTAYVASGAYQLGSSPDLPSHNFEVTGNLSGTVTGFPDANPADIISDYLTNPQYSIGLSTAKLAANLANYKTYCAAQGIFFSPILDQREQATMTIKRWAQLSNSFIFWSGNQLQFVPLGDSTLTANGATYTPQTTPVYDLTYDDFIVTKGSNPIKVSIIDPADGYNQVQIDINDRNNSYNNTPIMWKDQTSIDQYGQLMSQVISAKEICLQSIGQICAALVGKRSVYITKTYSFKLPRAFVFMEPGDIYTLTDPNIGLNRFPVRILSVKSGKDRLLTVTAEEFPYGIGTVSEYATQASQAGITFNTEVDPGNVNTPAIFEPNAAQTGGVPQVWIGASGGVNWGGANVYISFDGTTYSPIGTILAGLLQGTLITALPATADPDTTDTLYVDLTESDGVLPSTATHADADALRTLVLVDNEVLSYGSVTPGALNSYSFDLTYLRRAQYGTALASHAIGAPFWRIDPNFVFEYNLPQAYVGATLYFKFVSFNNFGNAAQDIASVTAYTYTPVGTAFVLNPPGMPVITASSATQSDGTTILSLTTTWTASTGPNLGSYEVQWSTNGGTSWTNDGTVGATALSRVLAPALASTNYLARVRAVSQNGVAVSAWEVSTSTNSGALVGSVPVAPTGISATAVSGGAMIDWVPSASASTKGYQVTYGTTNVFSSGTLYPMTTSGTGMMMTGLTAGTLYYFWVQAFNGAGASSPDGPVSATPTAVSAGLTVEQGGTSVVTNANTMNFTGAGVAVTNVSGVATVAIAGGSGGSGGGGINFGYLSTPAANQTFLVYPVGSGGMTLSSGLPGFAAKAEVAATAAVTIGLYKNGTSIGSINWAAAATVGTATFTAAVTFASGDVLTAVYQAATDATFANFGVVLVPVSGGGSAVALVSSQTVSGAASVRFTGLAAGYRYFVEWDNLTTSAVAVVVGFEVAGVLDSGSHYFWNVFRQYGGGGSALGATAFSTWPSVTTVSGGAARFDILGDPSVAQYHGISGTDSYFNSLINGQHNVIEAITGVRIYVPTGTLSGSFYLYSVQR